MDAKDYWGLGTFETEKRIKQEVDKNAGVLSIGSGVENMVKFANMHACRRCARLLVFDAEI